MPAGRVKGDKYKSKFCKQLMNGLRSDGMSIPELCQLWGITHPTYYRWKEIHPEFNEAAEYGERDCIGWWHRLTRAAACGQVKANAGVLCFAMKNIEGIGWQDKVEVTNSGKDQINTINISVLPSPPKQLNIIEHEDQEDES